MTVASPAGRQVGGTTPAGDTADHLDPGADRGAVDVAGYGAALAEGIEAALPGWVERSVTRIMTAWAGTMAPEVTAQAQAAGRQAAAQVGPGLRALLDADIDDQRTTPLALLRSAAVRYPTDVLAAAGVPARQRDRAAEELFPDDVYDLAPASFADLDPDLADRGLHWGAAKAFEHKRRHHPKSPGGGQ